MMEDHIGHATMRLTVTVPDDIADEVKARTDNVSAYVADALAGSAAVDASVFETLHEERRGSEGA